MIDINKYKDPEYVAKQQDEIEKLIEQYSEYISLKYRHNSSFVSHGLGPLLSLIRVRGLDGKDETKFSNPQQKSKLIEHYEHGVRDYVRQGLLESRVLTVFDIAEGPDDGVDLFFLKK